MNGNTPVWSQTTVAGKNTSKRTLVPQRILVIACVAAVLGSGCGGGSDPDEAGSTEISSSTSPAQIEDMSSQPSNSSSPAPAIAPSTPTSAQTETLQTTVATATVASVADKPSNRAEAARFLTQATFGPTTAAVDHLMSIGYTAWLNEQFAAPAFSRRAVWEAMDADYKARKASSTVGDDGVSFAFWKGAITGNDQLRQRMAFALSEIFVISLLDGNTGSSPRSVAAYLDMLGQKSFSNYRDLLESVSTHPRMGIYLSSLRNQKDDLKTGRVPDQNFAREVMQLFSIGLHQLNNDGTLKLVDGMPVETYGPADVAGLARVFTGWSWACPAWPDKACFNTGVSGAASDPDRGFKRMRGYPQFHSADEKKFLGVTIAQQSQADPEASLKVALNTLANHPNVGPFIGKQLIQRLVSSNPSPAYVAAVAAAFNNNGRGVRGDMKAVVKAILMHPEARTMSSTSGKVREPVLRLSALLRAFNFKSDSGYYGIGNTDNPGNALGTTAMRSPSVFNFYRPGYVPPGTRAAAAKLLAPEMQIAHEISAAGYVNFMRDGISKGFGVPMSGYQRSDLQPDFSHEIELAGKPADLVAHINARLMYGAMSNALKTEIEATLAKIVIPEFNPQPIYIAKRTRVHAALLLTLASPEFQIQK